MKSLQIVFFVSLFVISNTWADPLNNEKQIQTQETLGRAWVGSRAMHDIAVQLSFTPRSIGTAGHENTIKFIRNQVKQTRSKATILQRWNYEGSDGKRNSMTNVIVRFDPDNPRRLILGTHYDSIIRAYNDLINPDGQMPGANNSASGVALLLETARALSSLPAPPVGVDLVFFDGEEGPRALGAGDPEWMPLGSPYFAKHLAEFYPDRKPIGSIIFDMVCYKELKLNPERISIRSAGAEVEKLWAIGNKIAPSIFLKDTIEGPIYDDQSALAAINIPSILVVDFKYDPWFNTTQDTLDKCSKDSLEAVGWTIIKYLYSL